MSSDIASRKRPRVEHSVDGTVGDGNEPEPKRDNVQCDADIWFADGNVVLIAGNVAFRIHKSLLAQHSEVFSDLFTVPQPPDAEMMDGCPVVTVSDSPQDLKHLLTLIFKNKTFFHAGTPIPFGMLSALIRLGHKYGIETVVEQGLALLKTCFPDRFADWLNRSTAGVQLNLTPKDAIEVVDLARLTDTNSLLPTALYHCCQLDWTLLEGTQREDGTTVHLSPEDLRRCLKGKQELTLNTSRASAGIFLPELSDACKNRKQCKHHFMSVLRHAHLAPYFYVHCASLVGVDDPQMQEHWEMFSREPLCPSCTSMVRSRTLSAQRRAWRELPGNMDLQEDGWGDDIPWVEDIDEDPDAE